MGDNLRWTNTTEMSHLWSGWGGERLIIEKITAHYKPETFGTEWRVVMWILFLIAMGLLAVYGTVAAVQTPTSDPKFVITVVQAITLWVVTVAGAVVVGRARIPHKKSHKFYENGVEVADFYGNPLGKPNADLPATPLN